MSKDIIVHEDSYRRCKNCSWWYVRAGTRNGCGECKMFAYNCEYRRQSQTYVMPLEDGTGLFPIIYTEEYFGCTEFTDKDEDNV